MYFRLKDTPYGLIKISCEGLLSFINKTLSSKLRLYSVACSPDDLTIVISEQDIKPEKKSIVENHLIEVLKPMGMNASIIWATPEKGISHIIQNPYIWAFIASSIAVILTAGFDGLFWAAFWGASTWFLIKGISTLCQRKN